MSTYVQGLVRREPSAQAGKNTPPVTRSSSSTKTSATRHPAVLANTPPRAAGRPDQVCAVKRTTSAGGRAAGRFVLASDAVQADPAPRLAVPSHAQAGQPKAGDRSATPRLTRSGLHRSAVSTVICLETGKVLGTPRLQRQTAKVGLRKAEEETPNLVSLDSVPNLATAVESPLKERSAQKLLDMRQFDPFLPIAQPDSSTSTEGAVDSALQRSENLLEELRSLGFWPDSPTSNSSREDKVLDVQHPETEQEPKTLLSVLRLLEDLLASEVGPKEKLRALFLCREAIQLCPEELQLFAPLQSFASFQPQAVFDLKRPYGYADSSCSTTGSRTPESPHCGRPYLHHKSSAPKIVAGEPDALPYKSVLCEVAKQPQLVRRQSSASPARSVSAKRSVVRAQSAERYRDMMPGWRFSSCIDYDLVKPVLST